ncbi:TetR/AcrR family transcriptional regulator|uniref:TetR/AcrR family transcriptional regulator n=1 Tax=Noviherbaspirillum sp. L7-7A TaxID=2850560 RepID=UPI001C2B89E7|nr:TetR/AcrR family transcriptional regulator [Noviherbaspirillum sp. L7-7A]MBV0880566.1 TetR/AcrR family transcriptional regulator [Noviherbaspirillum sp. L7-7A]
MKVSRQQMAANRERLLDIASRLFRERGFDNVSVAEIMQQAGLTHGGFYGHFASKEALAAEAATHALLQTANRWRATLERSGTAGLERIVDAYLSQQHRDLPGAGCAIAALGPEVARQADPVRHAFAMELESLVGVLSGFLPGADTSARRKRALALMAQLVGAIVLARAFGSSDLSSEILDVVRAAVVLPDAAATTTA